MTVHKELILNVEIERDVRCCMLVIYNIIDECFLPAGLFYGSGFFWFFAMANAMKKKNKYNI